MPHQQQGKQEQRQQWQKAGEIFQLPADSQAPGRVGGMVNDHPEEAPHEDREEETTGKKPRKGELLGVGKAEQK